MFHTMRTPSVDAEMTCGDCFAPIACTSSAAAAPPLLLLPLLLDGAEGKSMPQMHVTIAVCPANDPISSPVLELTDWISDPDATNTASQSSTNSGLHAWSVPVTGAWLSMLLVSRNGVWTGVRCRM